MDQIINFRIKIIEPAVVRVLDNVKEIVFERIDNLLIAKEPNKTKTSTSLKPYKKIFLQFKTPSELKKHIGKKYKLYRRFINIEDRELFCIEPVDFELSNSSKVPYFTDRYFILPYDYINSHLDERAYTLRACYNLNLISNMESGILMIFITNKKESVSKAFHIKNKCMVSILPKDLKPFLLQEFVYDKTEIVTEYKYGVMYFHREGYDDRKDISAICRDTRINIDNGIRVERKDENIIGDQARA